MEDMEMIQNFWHGKRVFLTGHTGFKGSWLSLWLQQAGAVVTGYALAPSTNPNLFTLARVADNMTSIIGDIRDAKNLEEALENSKAEIVFHLAAQPLVRASYADPVETYSTNVMGTVHLLDAIRRQKTVKSVVVVTSDKCYENKEWLWGYRENEAMGGHDPYSNSKGCAELVVSAYRNSYFQELGIGLASGRAGNVIGGGDWSADRLVPDILSAMQNDKSLVIRSPNAIRPWQHVLEPLHGYMMLAEKMYQGDMRFSEAWNFGPSSGDVRPVHWIVDKLSELSGKLIPTEQPSNAQPHEANFLSLDSTKAQQILGWKPRWNLYAALAHIVEWHRDYMVQKDLRETTFRQIQEFINAQPIEELQA